MASKVMELETYRDILCRQVDLLQAYFDSLAEGRKLRVCDIRQIWLHGCVCTLWLGVCVVLLQDLLHHRRQDTREHPTVSLPVWSPLTSPQRNREVQIPPRRSPLHLVPPPHSTPTGDWRRGPLAPLTTPRCRPGSPPRDIVGRDPTRLPSGRRSSPWHGASAEATPLISLQGAEEAPHPT